MAAASDPYEPHLKRAADLFEAGDIVQAGQIWQAILKKKPDHEIARAGLYRVKLYFDARATQGGLVVKAPPVNSDLPATPGAPAKSDDPRIQRLLEEGCGLYDAGQVEEALARWSEVIKQDPGNVLAAGYISRAKNTLDQRSQVASEAHAAAKGVPLPAASPGAPQPAAPASLMESEQLLRDGCTLFDMGQVEDALKKWEQILTHDPDHALARAYAQDARKDLGLSSLEAGLIPAQANPVPRPEARETAPEDEHLDALIRDGVQLYDLGMVEEAMQKWQQVLDIRPGHPDAEAYFAMGGRDLRTPPPAVRPVTAPCAPDGEFPALQPKDVLGYETTPVTLVEFDFLEPKGPPPITGPATPPPSLTSGIQKVRKGFNLPEVLQRISLPAWVATPAFILCMITLMVVMVVGSFYLLKHRKDTTLRAAVEAFRVSATAPVMRDSEVKSLTDTPGSMRERAQEALEADPLLAYLTAQELTRLEPGDAALAQLFEQAKTGLSGPLEGGPATLADYEKQIQGGDFAAADRSMEYLLRQNPNDATLRERAGRLYVTFCRSHALREEWEEAEARLRRCQGLFPADRSWNLKLQLLSRIRSMPKSDQARWIQLLG